MSTYESEYNNMSLEDKRKEVEMSRKRAIENCGPEGFPVYDMSGIVFWLPRKFNCRDCGKEIDGIYMNGNYLCGLCSVKYINCG